MSPKSPYPEIFVTKMKLFLLPCSLEVYVFVSVCTCVCMYAFSSPFYRWGNRGTEVSGLPRVTWLVSGRAGFKLRPLGLQSHLPSRVYELLVLRHAVCSRGVVPVLEAHGPCGEYGCDLSCNHGGCQEVARVCPVGFSMTETAVGIRCTGERLGRRVGGNSVSSVHPSVLPGQSPERCRPG